MAKIINKNTGETVYFDKNKCVRNVICSYLSYKCPILKEGLKKIKLFDEMDFSKPSFNYEVKFCWIGKNDAKEWTETLQIVYPELEAVN